MENIFKEPKKSLSEKWNDLPQAAHIAVYAGGAGLAAVLILGVLFYFFRQRRKGAKEAQAAALRAEHEMGGLHAKWQPGDTAYVGAGEAVREKGFAGMGPRPDNSWPEEGGGGHAAPLLGHDRAPGSPVQGGFSGAYDPPQSPPRSASAAPPGYAQVYDAPQSPQRSASAAPGYGYGGPGFR